MRDTWKSLARSGVPFRKLYSHDYILKRNREDSGTAVAFPLFLIVFLMGYLPRR